MSRLVSEAEFSVAIRTALNGMVADCVTGPGRSGAVAAVYASHILGIPFIPYGQRVPDNLPRLLIVDTATESGATLRKAVRKYNAMHLPEPLVVAVYQEPPRVMFWYESGKPQRYRHENKENEDD